MVIGHVDRAARRLAERVVDPDFLLHAEQMSKFAPTSPEAAQRFLPAEAVRDPLMWITQVRLQPAENGLYVR